MLPEKKWLLEVTDGFRAAAVIGAAAELGLFDLIPEQGADIEELAQKSSCPQRGLRILCDALAALEVLQKEADRYFVPARLRPVLSESSPDTAIPMIRHRMSCMRGWVQLAWTVRAGIPAPRTSGLRGPEGDWTAFILAMGVVSREVADNLVKQLQPLQFRLMLDVGCGPGIWAFAFLRAVPGSRAILFDLPQSIVLTRQKAEEAGLADRVEFVPGNFYRDDLPRGADFAWVSAICHQNSREQNRQLFRKVYEALIPGGQIAIRDVVMDRDRTSPLDGALFAVNMLASTPGGGTYTLEEYQEDLLAAGFSEPHLRVRADSMNSVIVAHRR